MLPHVYIVPLSISFKNHAVWNEGGLSRNLPPWALTKQLSVGLNIFKVMHWVVLRCVMQHLIKQELVT